MRESISKKIKLLRLEKGISQKQLSDYLGISDRAISKWENGLSNPSVENLFELSKIFQVSLDYFTTKDKLKDKIEPTFEGMESLTELYKIGRGPSSSHTIGPERACIRFRENNNEADKFSAILYGSLAKTGRGHGTDVVIRKTFAPISCDVEFNYLESNILHPNTFDLIAYKNDIIINRARVYSIGGGSIKFENEKENVKSKIYKYSSFSDIANYCKERQIKLWKYVMENEASYFERFLEEIWNTMKSSIQRGLIDVGILPGGLEVKKKAGQLYNNQHIDESPEIRENRIVCSYAFAVSEQNASGEHIVTAPTCGAVGVLPAVLYYQQQKNGFSDSDIIKALATAGLIGNIIKTNASVSGAECGCQPEKLLKAGKTVAETSESTGFSSQSYFNKVFKKYNCCSPSQFKELSNSTHT